MVPEHHSHLHHHHTNIQCTRDPNQCLRSGAIDKLSALQRPQQLTSWLHVLRPEQHGHHSGALVPFQPRVEPDPGPDPLPEPRSFIPLLISSLRAWKLTTSPSFTSSPHPAHQRDDRLLAGARQLEPHVRRGRAALLRVQRDRPLRHLGQRHRADHPARRPPPERRHPRHRPRARQHRQQPRRRELCVSTPPSLACSVLFLPLLQSRGPCGSIFRPQGLVRAREGKIELTRGRPADRCPIAF